MLFNQCNLLLRMTCEPERGLGQIYANHKDLLLGLGNPNASTARHLLLLCIRKIKDLDSSRLSTTSTVDATKAKWLVFGVVPTNSMYGVESRAN